MKSRDFITKLEDSAVLEAISDIESRTSAEVRVMISSRKIDDALRSAWQAFARMGMDQTAARNGVLIFIAPEAQKFAIIGDEGIHQRCDPGHWEMLATEMTAGFKSQNFTAALVQVIQKIGHTLAIHFPRNQGDRNELADAVSRE
jgi:uncharacterized membrane protein